MTTPTPADEALARELAGVFGITLDDQASVKGSLNILEAAQLIAAHVAAQAPSGSLVEALEAVDDDDTGVLNTEDTKDFKLGYAAGVKQVQDEVKEIVAAHKAQPVHPGSPEKTQLVKDALHIIHTIAEGREGYLNSRGAAAILRYVENLEAAQPVADVRGMVERNEYLEKLFARMGTIRASAKPLGLELVGKQLGCEELVGIALAYAANWFSDDAPKFEKVLEFTEFISSNSHSTAALASARHAMGGEMEA